MESGRRWTWTVLGTACAAALLVGCGAPAAAPPAADAVADGGAVPVPTLAQEEVEGTGPFAPATGSGGPCDTNAIADLVGSFEGEPSAGDALVRWLQLPRGGAAADPLAAPPGVPSDGWVAEQEPGTGPAQREWQTRGFASGAWRATAVRSSGGTWLVTRFGCTTG